MTLTANQEDIADLVLGAVSDTEQMLDALIVSLGRHLDDLGPDAAHWLRDAREAAVAYADSLTAALTCSNCPALAVWLHPKTLDRYCGDCSENHAQCVGCSDWLTLKDVSVQHDGTFACFDCAASTVTDRE